MGQYLAFPLWLVVFLVVCLATLLGAAGLVVIGPLCLVACLLACCDGPRSVAADPRGKRVVVTGGSSGIGKAIAQAFADRGAHVTLVARDVKKLEAAEKEIRSRLVSGSTGSVNFAAVDVSGEVADITKSLCTAMGTQGDEVVADILVCSAGVSLPATFEESTAAEWDQTLRVNIMGTVNPIKAVIAGMKQRRSGHVLMISSMAGQVGVFGMSSYNTSKFALRGLGETLRMECEPFGVHISMAMPPDVDTPMYAKEMEVKPAECKLISGGAGLWTADEIAKSIVRSMGSAPFFIGFGIDGWMMNHLTAGMVASSSLWQFASGALLLPLFRTIAVCYSFYFDWLVLGEHRKKNSLREPLLKLD